MRLQTSTRRPGVVPGKREGGGGEGYDVGYRDIEIERDDKDRDGKTK